jgi:hypothetical protein
MAGPLKASCVCCGVESEKVMLRDFDSLDAGPIAANPHMPEGPKSIYPVCDACWAAILADHSHPCLTKLRLQ